MGCIIHLPLTTKYTVANSVSKNIKYLTEECSAEKDAAEKEVIRGSHTWKSALGTLHKMRNVASRSQTWTSDVRAWNAA